MRILLINNNPVVSRLTALSARKEDIEIDEIQEVTELNANSYDIVFVDADSWSKDVRDVISENINMQKSVLFYGDGDEDEKDSFDIAILKPFLPSEVSAVIRSVEELPETAKPTLETEENFDILAEGKKTLEDDLFDLDALESKDTKKEKVAEVADNAPLTLESNDVSFDDKLAEAFPSANSTLDDDLLKDDDKVELTLSDDLITQETKKEDKLKDEKSKEDNFFDLNLDDDLPSLEDDLFTDDKKAETKSEKNSHEKSDVVADKEEMHVAESKKEETPKEKVVHDVDDFVMDDLVLESVDGASEQNIKLPTDSPLEFDTLGNTAEEKAETKVLDEVEIAKIKGILTDDSSDEVSLETVIPVSEKSLVQGENQSLPQGDVQLNSEVLAQTLTSMPVGALRELLAGAKVSIKIKFPDAKK